MAARNYSFSFEADTQAQTFVIRAIHLCSHLAVYRNGTTVYVVDAGDEDQREALMRLARLSGALRATWRPSFDGPQ